MVSKKEHIFNITNMTLRLVILASLVIGYVVDSNWLIKCINSFSWIYIIWGLILIGLIIRLVPILNIHVGTKKIYKTHFVQKDYDKSKLNQLKNKDRCGIFVVFLIGLVATGTIFILYYVNIIDDGILLIVSMVYLVLATVCEEIFCPFSYILFGAKCCNKCRIYGWDYIFSLQEEL